MTTPAQDYVRKHQCQHEVEARFCVRCKDERLANLDEELRKHILEIEYLHKQETADFVALREAQEEIAALKKSLIDLGYPT